MGLLSACGRHVAERAEVAVPHSTTAKYNYFFLEALRLEQNGQYAAAFDLLRHCAQTDSLAPEAYYMLGMYYPPLGEYEEASNCLERAVRLNPKNDAYHERLAQWYIQTSDFNAAIDAYENLYASNRSRDDVLEILLNLYQQRRNYDGMLQTIGRMEQLDGTSEETTLSKMRVYQQMGEKEKALGALRQLSEGHPNDVSYKLMMGNWLQQNSRSDEARAVFLEAESEEPDNESVAASLYDFYRQQGEDSLATVYRDRILLNKYTESGTKITILKNIIKENERSGSDSTEVLSVFRQVMEADPENVDVADLNSVYMQLKNMPGELIDAALSHILDIAPDNVSARLRLLHSKWQAQDWDEIVSICQPALEYNPDEMAFCYYLGMAYYQQDRKPEALDAFRRGVSRINDKSDKDLVSDFYAMMGDLLQQMGDLAEAYAAYDSCLQWKPDNVACLNNYAYFLCINGGDLDKAEAMSRIAIRNEPNSATYLDTYAWIMFKQEHYLEAKSFIDRTIDNMDPEADNSTLFDHAGDIYEACGETDKAVEYWEQALGDDEKANAAIRKKIRRYEK